MACELLYVTIVAAKTDDLTTPELGRGVLNVVRPDSAHQFFALLGRDGDVVVEGSIRVQEAPIRQPPPSIGGATHLGLVASS
ncbi:hypothetical protein MCEMSEM18_03484 [Comamonadaceae bacterium]